MRESSFRSLFHQFYANKLLLFAWVVAWLFPWGHWLAYDGNLFIVFLMDMLRLGLALGLFLLPGIALYWLILPVDDVPKTFSLALIPIGFVFSTLMIGVLGLLGRVTGMPFIFLKILFSLAGFLGILLVQMKALPSLNKFIEKSRSQLFLSPFLVVALLFVTLINFHSSHFFIDDWTYLAYLTQWQYASSLDFREVIFGTHFDDPARFWFSLYPMSQALLADLGGIPGILLLGNYLEFYLMPIAVFAQYFAGRTLGLSRHNAGFAVLAHVIFLTWIFAPNLPVGTWFYQSMSEDKVSAAFIFSPVLISFALRFFQSPNRRNLILMFLAGLGITFTHPIILFLVSCIVAGMFLVAAILRKTSWQSLAVVFVFILVWAAPYLGVRFSGHSSVSRVTYSGEQARDTLTVWMHLNIREDGSYSITPELLNFIDFRLIEIELPAGIDESYQVIRFLPWIMILLAGLIAALRLQQGWLNYYLAVSVVAISLALIPYTAWILGLFTSARLLSRISWFAPLGLSLVFLIEAGWVCFSGWLHRLWPGERKVSVFLGAVRKRATFFGLTICLVIGLISPLSLTVLTNFPAFFESLRFHQQLARVGEFMREQNFDNVVVISLDESGVLDNYLPGIAHVIVPVSFREEVHSFEVKYFFSLEELMARQEDAHRLRSFSPDVSLDERLVLLDRYNVQYILAEQDQAQAYALLLNQNARILKPVYENELFVLFSVLRDAMSVP
jgi:hypothetical protein